MRSGEVILSILAFKISPQNHSSTSHPTISLDVASYMLENLMRPQLKLRKYVDTELIAATRVFSFSIAEQHTCINLHIKRLDGRMCCVRKYLKKSFCIC
jgi:hypothetical protein